MAQVFDLRRQRGARKPAPVPYMRSRSRFRPQSYFGFIALGLLMAFGAAHSSDALVARVPSGIAKLLPNGAAAPQVARHFPICGGGARRNCVVDGDTFYLDGAKIRVSDIDTPEVSEPECAREARLGAQATRRFQALLNAGPIELRRGIRDEDIYGRKLRTVHRDGRSLGSILVAEGLAHGWIGYKQSWCA